MTQGELDALLLYFRQKYLDANNIYLNRLKIGQYSSSYNQQFILEVLDWYMFVYDVYYEAEDRDKLSVSLEDIVVMKENFDKLIYILKTAYNGKTY